MKACPNEAKHTITVLHESEEWNTQFDGDITKVRINGEDIFKTHDLTKEVSQVGRQVRVLAIGGVSLGALAIILLLALGHSLLINNKYDAQMELTNSRKLMHSRMLIRDRLYELTGNIWVGNKWIVDPSWQQIANSTPSPSK